LLETLIITDIADKIFRLVKALVRVWIENLMKKEGKGESILGG
jgi:hypothetical protein